MEVSWMVIASEVRQEGPDKLDLLGIKTADYVDSVPADVRFSVAALLELMPDETGEDLHLEFRMGMPGRKQAVQRLSPIVVPFSAWSERRATVLYHNFEIKSHRIGTFTIELVQRDAVLATAEYSILQRSASRT